MLRYLGHSILILAYSIVWRYIYIETIQRCSMEGGLAEGETQTPSS